MTKVAPSYGTYKRRVEFGRYRLDEIVEALERSAIQAGIAPEQIYKSLRDAIRAKQIKAYLPDSLLPFEYDGDLDFDHDDIGEVCWDDLNAWLEINEPRIHWRFPDPSKDYSTANLATVNHVVEVNTQNIGATGSEDFKEKWKSEAVRLGKAYIREWRLAGYEPTRKDTAHYVEGELSTLKIYGIRESPSAAYIERHALPGITGRKQGYKSKQPRIPEKMRGKLPDFK